MPSSFIPQRVKRAKQQITVKLYQDQLALLHSYGRFIDDTVITLSARLSNWCSKETKNSPAGRSRREMTTTMPNRRSAALIPLA